MPSLDSRFLFLVDVYSIQCSTDHCRKCEGFSTKILKPFTLPTLIFSVLHLSLSPNPPAMPSGFVHSRNQSSEDAVWKNASIKILDALIHITALLLLSIFRIDLNWLKFPQNKRGCAIQTVFVSEPLYQACKEKVPQPSLWVVSFPNPICKWGREPVYFVRLQVLVAWGTWLIYCWIL